LTLYWRAGKVTFLPLPVRRSQTEKPISFMAVQWAVGEVQLGVSKLASGVAVVVRGEGGFVFS
jgi:hypothetical protein